MNKLWVISCSLRFTDDIDCHLIEWRIECLRRFGDLVFAYKRTIDVFLLLTFYKYQSDVSKQATGLQIVSW